MIAGDLIRVLDALGLKYSFGFITFFLISAVGVYYHRNPLVRKGWTVAFVVMLFVPVVIGSNWPFLAWGLFAEPAPTEVTHYQTYLVESDGDHVRYDTRALGPVTAAVFRGYSKKLVTEWNEPTSERMGSFLVSRANDHREAVKGGYGFRPNFWLPNGFRFPRHQLDYRWGPGVINSNDSFVGIRIYRVSAEISQDGSAIQSVTCTPVRSIPGNGTSSEDVPAAPETPPFEPCNQ